MEDTVWCPPWTFYQRQQFFVSEEADALDIPLDAPVTLESYSQWNHKNKTRNKCALENIVQAVMVLVCLCFNNTSDTSLIQASYSKSDGCRLTWDTFFSSVLWATHQAFSAWPLPVAASSWLPLPHWWPTSQPSDLPVISVQQSLVGMLHPMTTMWSPYVHPTRPKPSGAVPKSHSTQCNENQTCVCFIGTDRTH